MGTSTSAVFEVTGDNKIEIVNNSTELSFGNNFSNLIASFVRENIIAHTQTSQYSQMIDSRVKETIKIMQGPSAPQNLTVTGGPPGDVYLDITWESPKYSNNLLGSETTGNSVKNYEIQISKDKNFDPIDYLKNNIPDSSTNFKITLNNYTGLKCTGYFVQIRAQNSEDKWGDYAKYDDYENNPTLVSSGDYCFTYSGKEEWNTISNSYKKLLKHIIFEGPTIPYDVLDASNTDGSFNDQNFRTETFTIIIKESVTDISMQAFENLKNLIIL